MTDQAQPVSLRARLRELRSGWGVTQKDLSTALGVSGALLSSWENGNATPPPERLESYATFFATTRTLERKPPALIEVLELSDDEQTTRQELLNGLMSLRNDVRPMNGPRPSESGALGGTFWHFPDGQPVTIFCTPLTPRQLLGPGNEKHPVDETLTPAQQYAMNTAHPNFVRNFNNGDVDALVELVGHIRAENPGTDVQWTTYDRSLGADALTGHVVVLGSGDAFIPLRQGDTPSELESLIRQLNVPVQIGETIDESLDVDFRLRFQLFTDDSGNPDVNGKHLEYLEAPFRRDVTRQGARVIVNGAPLLDGDLALIVRSENPFNTSATVTVCAGLFSRGTYGAVRAFTDANLRGRNTQYLAGKGVENDFWMLVKVPIAGERTITPDLARDAHRLKESF